MAARSGRLKLCVPATFRDRHLAWRQDGGNLIRSWASLDNMASRVARVWTAFLVFSLHSLSGSGSGPARVFMEESELVGLQQLWDALKEGTPDLEANLSGWYTFNATQMAEEGSLDGDPCLYHSWAGVSCYASVGVSVNGVNGTSMTFANGTRAADPSEVWWTASVVSLTLQDASLVGQLPSDAIGNLAALSSLIVSGNPNVTGPPLVIAQSRLYQLKVIDLHGNAFTGQANASSIISYPKEFLEYLDLSYNELSGELPDIPFPRLRRMSFGGNNFSGSMPLTYFGTGSEPLISMDMSSNNFVGPLANLTYPNLHLLNLSSNAFNGTIDPANVFSGSMNLIELDLSHNKFIGHMPNLGLLSALQSLDLSYNAFYPGQFPDWLLLLKDGLQILDLSGTNLIGGLNLPLLNKFSNLRILKLDNNAINGTLDIGKISQDLGAKSLQAVSLQYNSITDVTYNTSWTIQDLGNWININLQGNPYCNGLIQASDLQRCICKQYCFDTNQIYSNKSIKKTIIVATSTSSIVTGIIILISILVFWKNRQEKKKLILALHQRFADYEMKPTLYAYSELQKATKNFSADTKLGQGEYGAVYKGILSDGSIVAVKQLLTSPKQNMDDFLNEVILLTGVKHRNLVKLKGCCLRETQRLLVFEYVENHDLSIVLFESKNAKVLDWPTRLDICLGVAQGLHYLHALVEPRMIHRDIKASNILLDKKFQPKIADFGLALLFPDNKTHIMTIHVAGTRGYLAPEYATYGQLSEKVDVYSFGVLLLEVLSGRRNIDTNYPMDRRYLVVWAQRLSKEAKLLDLVDPVLKALMDEDLAEVQLVINVALLCVQIEGEFRPSMSHVVAMLKGDMEVEMLKEDMEEIEMPEFNKFNSSFGSAVTDETSMDFSMLWGGSSSNSQKPI